MENFYDIKAGTKGKRDSFEELSCQIFRRKFSSNNKVFQRYRGDGGDGGVEAVYINDDLTEIGLQSKYWEYNSFDSAEITQLTHSLDTALKNHPNLKSYIITIPFNLTGKVAEGKRGKSQTEKYTEWKNKIEEEKTISITLWDATSLSDILHECDSSGGLFRFWFDKDCFSLEQYQRFSEEVIAQAGKRYTPELNIDVPLYKVLNSFSEKKQFFQEKENIIKLFEQYEGNYIFEEYLNLEYNAFNRQISELLAQLKNSLCNKNEIQLSSLKNKLQDFKNVISEKEINELKRLEKQNGFSDTPGYRQFMAEYMCTFPCALLDEYRELIKDLVNIIDYINSNVVKAFYSQFMIITGPAGIGKTHSIVDFMSKSSEKSEFVFFGEDFSINEPWIVFRDKLGLPSNLTKDQVFQLLSINAETNNSIGVIFIDAINESLDYTKWHSWLPVLIQNIKNYHNLKLCISCRDTFNSDFEEEFSKYPIINHNGFIGNEYLAINSFCDYYEIIPPSYPLFNSELGNPLFLHLLCETISDEEIKEFPKGQFGLSSIFEKFTRLKNKNISRKCDVDPEDYVLKKVFSLATEKMISTKKRYLVYTEFQEITKSIYETSSFTKSLIYNLEKESVITKFRIDSETRIRFTYDRLTDYYVASYILEGNYISYLENKQFCNENPSIVEMLSILLPEKDKNIEILDFSSDKATMIAFTKSLNWRDSLSITKKTLFYVRKLLGIQDYSIEIMNAIISLSVIPNHGLNEDFIENLFLFNSMPDRDKFFCYYLMNDYDNKNSAWQLINRACFSQFDNYSQDSLLLWCKMLSWFCSSSDRRIRDQSSKGLTRILRYDYSLCELLFENFKQINDDYIIERLSQSIYSSLLLSRNQNNIENFASYVLKNNLLEYYDNIVIIDNLRLIVELAYLSNSNFLTKEKYLEIVSLSSNNIFKKVDENLFQTLIRQEEFNDKNINFVGNWYTDFQRYILGNKIEIFDLKVASISKEDIYKWFVVKLSELGYPGRQSSAWHFDRYLIGTYGNGRGKPIYVERLSKKYYWILLHKLIALLKNTCKLKESRFDDENESIYPRLFSIDLRDIDLTDLRYCSKKEYPKLNFQKLKIDFERNPKDWILYTEDFFDEDFYLKNILDNNGNQWVALNFVQRVEAQNGNKKYPYKESCILISSSFISNTHFNKLSDEDLRKMISGNVFDDVTKDYRLFLGEIQKSRTYNEYLERNRILEKEYRDDRIDIYPSSIELLRGKEWEYDCSFESDNILVPSKYIIDKLHLSWDEDSGWLDENRILCVFSQIIDNHVGLFIRKDYLNKIISKENIIIVRIYKEKMYIPNEGGWNSSMHNERILLAYDGKETKHIINYSDENDYRE